MRGQTSGFLSDRICDWINEYELRQTEIVHHAGRGAEVPRKMRPYQNDVTIVKFGAQFLTPVFSSAICFTRFRSTFPVPNSGNSAT